MVLLQCSEEDVRTPVMAEALPSALVSDWIDLQLILAKESPGFTAPIVARALGYSGLTFYESVVAGTIRNKSLVGQLTQIDFLPAPLPNTEYHWGLSANAAAAEISRKIFENAPAPRLTKIDSLENSYRKFWGEVSAAVSDRSIEFGKKVADSIYSYSKTDGGHKAFNRNFPATYTPPAGPGLWQPTNSQLALLPYWGANRTFIKGLNARVTTTGFPAYSTNPSSAFFAEAQQVYTTGKNLTPTQTTIAYYWADEGFVTYTPAGHSFAILSQLFRKEAFNLAAAALASVKLGMAMSDAFVYCWDVKYAKNLLRPSQFIQANIDALWVPLIPNPPFPEYTSGHSTQAAAASRVLASIFGENYSFTDFTHNKLGLGLAPRTFGTFYQMAEEAGQSRIYAGIHFSSGNLQGRASGYMIADEVLKLSFTK
ncbi:MAG: vanadium-dependent haloperoxidase [Cytophagales bacterium]|nr:vanadium-dependent haloperoxidase [Cytophagales bacterium]